MEVLISANKKILFFVRSLRMGGPYKRSRFNYVVQKENGYVIYNTLYNSLTKLTVSEHEQYASLKFKTSKLRRNFIQQGLIISANVDESEKYDSFIRKYASLFLPHPRITVTPTMECNARCFYCYENGVRCGKMQQKDIPGMIRTIKKLDYRKGIDLTWFGGEPLLNQEWMDCFSDRLKEEGIRFSSFIISNGSKIDDNVIEKMKRRWNINRIQITLDGDCEEYRKRKAYTDCGEDIYFRLLRMIGKISKAGIEVSIRLNIDRRNRESIVRAVQDLVQLYKNDSNVTCYPAFLTGMKENLSEDEKVEFVKRLLEVGEGKINVNEYLYKLPRMTACDYYQKNAFSIDTNGNLYICEHMLGHKEYAVGNINENCDLSQVDRAISGQREECRNCVFLTKCHGGCTDAYIGGAVPCFIDKYVLIAFLESL